jgi:hypothetical protein
MARIAETVVKMALEGDMQAIKEIGDRMDGKPSQQVEHEPGEVMREIVVRWARSQEAIDVTPDDSGGALLPPPAVPAAPRED